MTDPIHERVSAQLRDLATGRLAAEEEASARAHVGRCDLCAGELRVIRLLSAPTDDAMTDRERRRMRSAVTGAIEHAAHRRGSDASAPPRRRGAARWQSLATGLSAAAVVAGLIFGITKVDLSGTDESTAAGGSVESSDAGGRGGAGSGGDAVAESAEGDRAVADPARSKKKNQDTEAAAAAGTTMGAAAPPPGEPIFAGDIGRISQRSLRARGREVPFPGFAEQYAVEDVPALRDDHLEQIAIASPVPDQVRDCGRRVLNGHVYAVLPAYGATGRGGQQQDVLVLGFAWTPAAEGPLDSYMLWAWRFGDCARPLEYAYGKVLR